MVYERITICLSVSDAANGKFTSGIFSFFTSEEIVQSVSGVHFDRIMTKLVAVTEELLRSFVFSQATSTFKFFRPKICF